MKVILKRYTPLGHPTTESVYTDSYICSTTNFTKGVFLNCIIHKFAVYGSYIYGIQSNFKVHTLEFMTALCNIELQKDFKCSCMLIHGKVVVKRSPYKIHFKKCIIDVTQSFLPPFRYLEGETLKFTYRVVLSKKLLKSIAKFPIKDFSEGLVCFTKNKSVCLSTKKVIVTDPQIIGGILKVFPNATPELVSSAPDQEE